MFPSIFLNCGAVGDPTLDNSMPQTNLYAKLAVHTDVSLRVRYVTSFREHVVFEALNDARPVMSMKKKHLFSFRREVEWDGFKGAIYTRLSHPLWFCFLPFAGRYVSVHHEMIAEDSRIVARTVPSSWQTVTFIVGDREVHYDRINRSWKWREFVLCDDDGDLVVARSDNNEIKVLRHPPHLLPSLALFLIYFMSDRD